MPNVEFIGFPRYKWRDLEAIFLKKLRGSGIEPDKVVYSFIERAVKDGVGTSSPFIRIYTSTDGIMKVEEIVRFFEEFDVELVGLIKFFPAKKN